MRIAKGRQLTQMLNHITAPDDRSLNLFGCLMVGVAETSVHNVLFAAVMPEISMGAVRFISPCLMNPQL